MQNLKMSKLIKAGSRMVVARGWVGRRWSKVTVTQDEYFWRSDAQHGDCVRILYYCALEIC